MTIRFQELKWVFHCLFLKVYLKNHYGFNIVTFQSILLQFAIGYFTYGGDRFFDSFDKNPVEDKEFYTKYKIISV